MIKTLIENLSCAHSEPVLTRFTAQTEERHHELLRCSYITWSLLKEGVQKVYATSGINPQLFSKQEAYPVSETTFHISWISLQDYTETLTCLIPSDVKDKLVGEGEVSEGLVQRHGEFIWVLLVTADLNHGSSWTEKSRILQVQLRARKSFHPQEKHLTLSVKYSHLCHQHK